MAETARFGIPYPSARQKTWYAGFASMVEQLASRLFDVMEATSLLIIETGTTTWVDGAGPNAGKGVATVSDEVWFVSRTTGMKQILPATTFALAPGEFAYIELARGVTEESEVEVQIGSVVPVDSAIHVIGQCRLYDSGLWFMCTSGLAVPPNTDPASVWNLNALQDLIDNRWLSKVSTNDTTPGFLNTKVTAGTGIGRTILTPGAAEVMQFAHDGTFQVSSNDTTRKRLQDKLVGGTTGVTLAVLNEGGDEQLRLDGDSKTKVAEATTRDYLENLLVAGAHVSITKVGNTLVFAMAEGNWISSSDHLTWFLNPANPGGGADANGATCPLADFVAPTTFPKVHKVFTAPLSGGNPYKTRHEIDIVFGAGAGDYSFEYEVWGLDNLPGAGAVAADYTSRGSLLSNGKILKVRNAANATTPAPMITTLFKYLVVIQVAASGVAPAVNGTCVIRSFGPFDGAKE